ncbi:hypothetical protein AAFC00_004269 [Neodothiora populina]|uniref:Glucose-methanol-choline oxidoreductase N-terminal domain-containing protein n=1 Tax=Neodothiora populina TaxID=2781224 RepID=A0ABR3PJ61_9PEZI
MADYIIIGGGTAGLVVASRLTEDPSLRVLVIEAGADHRSDPRIVVPGLASQVYGDPDFDWTYISAPQRGLNGRQLHQPAGKGLGGSSAINLGLMIYPSLSGFNSWENLGNPDWGWDGMAPYFRKFHTFHPPSDGIKNLLSLDYIDQALHGTSGPIQTCFGEDILSYTPYNEAWPKAFKELHQMTTRDPLTGNAIGAFSNTGTIDPKTRQRSHAGNAYLNEEVASRSNLQIMTETVVTRILLEDDFAGSFVAVGVEIMTKHGERQTLSAAEVILAAGAVKSPQILELSGIGDASILQSKGIEVKVDNPNVGENLQEHGYVPMSYEVADGLVSGDMLRDPAVAKQLIDYYSENRGAGPLGVCTIASSYMPIVDFASEEGQNELEALLERYLDTPEHLYKDFPGKESQYRLLRKILHDPEEASGQYTFAHFQITPDKGVLLKDVYGMSEEGQFISVVSVLNHPFSRGSVHIASSDPLAKPSLDTGLLEHPLDLELIAHHILWTENLVSADPLSKLLKPGGKRLPPMPSEPGKMTLEQAKQIATDRVVPHYHLCGTCAMMPERKGGVVDSKLKVYGTKGLRVVDASVFPLIPRGNIQSSVYAVAEKAADIIKGELADEADAEDVQELLSEWRKSGS